MRFALQRAVAVPPTAPTKVNGEHDSGNEPDQPISRGMNAHSARDHPYSSRMSAAVASTRPRPGPEPIDPARSAAVARVRIICDGQNCGASAGAARSVIGAASFDTPIAASFEPAEPTSERPARRDRIRNDEIGANDGRVRFPERRTCPAGVGAHALGEHLAFTRRVSIAIR